VRYLLEESHELAEAIETGDRAGMREELGDVLLQVLFHARIAADEPEPFTVDDVAADLVAKLVRRHPHVFAGEPVADVHAQWEAIKQEEKGRTSVLEGIPLAQGALARAQKVLSRARRAGIEIGAEPAGTAPDLGAELLDLVRRADDAGIDAESALRHALRGLEAVVVSAEEAFEG
jgi:XTP/dITP diphosphohydrolase